MHAWPILGPSILCNQVSYLGHETTYVINNTLLTLDTLVTPYGPRQHVWRDTGLSNPEQLNTLGMPSMAAPEGWSAVCTGDRALGLLVPISPFSAPLGGEKSPRTTPGFT